jgi:PAS domain S-box-containing protein
MQQPSKLVDYVLGSFTIARCLYGFVVCISAVFGWIFLSSSNDSRRQLDQLALSQSSTRAALYAEQVNSLIYAVVMESRGIYMSSDPALIKVFAGNLLRFNDQIAGAVANWEQFVGAEDAAQFAGFKERIHRFIGFRRELVRRGLASGSPAAREWGDNDANRSVRTALNVDLELLTKIYVAKSKTADQAGLLNQSSTHNKSRIAGAALLALILGAVVMARLVIIPLTRITQVTFDLAANDHYIEIPYLRRRDEIGTLARGVKKFQRTMISNLRMSKEAVGAAERLSAATDNMTSGLIMLDKMARLVVCNQAYRDMYGLPPEIAKPGASLLDILKYRVAAGTMAGDPDKVFAAILERIKSGAASTQEVAMTDGRVLQVLNRGMSDGGWVATHIDITAARKVELSLERTELLLATVCENTSDAIVFQDAQSAKYMFVNRAGETLFGLPRESMVGKTAKDIFTQKTAAVIEKQTSEVVDTKAKASFSDYVIETPKHGRRMVSSQRFPICSSDGQIKCIVGVTEDRTAA